MEKKRKSNAGRKGAYKKWLEADNLILLEGWARDGLTDEQIAHNIGIHVSTLYEWKKKYKEFDEALKKGKEVVDTLVENALLKRALGYEYDEVTEIREEGVLMQKKTVRKQVVPDTTAQIFWLKNRRPDVWRDKKDIDMNANISNPFDGISTVDIKKLIRNEQGN